MSYIEDGKLKEAGDFFFIEDQDGIPTAMEFICPCGCGKASLISADPEKEPHCNWNEHVILPTMTLCIRTFGNCGWQGYIKDGKWKSKGA